MQVAGPTFEEVLRKNFKRVLTYWSQIGTVMGLSAVGLGLISLYMYTRAIGRTDPVSYTHLTLPTILLV